VDRDFIVGQAGREEDRMDLIGLFEKALDGSLIA
jgi:hypothetical protein